MVKEDNEQKAQLIRMLASNYSAALNEEAATLWLTLLAPYSVEHCRRAVLAVLRRYGHEAVQFGFMPPFALVQKELDRISGALHGEENTAAQAEAEWGRLLEEARRAGSWRVPALHPTTALVVRQFGGWNVVCAWKEAELSWKHKEFIAAWRAASGREDAFALGADAVALLGAASSKPLALTKEYLKNRLERKAKENDHAPRALCL
ncbi:DUF6475 domain-containing protein [Mailhella massiliensis]|uniref:DUF6475 domain-containing protein n=1 Tax=Mailhella massiliensis TaxID=1903261 RepID=A0A921AXD4_9BACT|nr:DUF6475 domain-containing protein [Mailhella massiliensis]HJD97796.1 DUF6475 domain-containing protein [Mailhella massiliensis]